ncbi:MAG: RT0821/Lpp0805 family surface protein [Mariprofundus sp.]
MNKFIFGIALASMVFSTPTSSFALSGLGFLSKSPIAYFTPEDSCMLKSTLKDVLNHKPDGQTVKWKNEESGHFGKIKAIRTFTQQGIRCRAVKFFNSAGGVTGQGTFNFCKQDDGSWKIAE